MRKREQHRREREATVPQDEQEDMLNELLLNKFEEVIELVPDDRSLRLELLSRCAILKIEGF
jgi:hypothetical protein